MKLTRFSVLSINIEVNDIKQLIPYSYFYIPFTLKKAPFIETFKKNFKKISHLTGKTLIKINNISRSNINEKNDNSTMQDVMLLFVAPTKLVDTCVEGEARWQNSRSNM